MRKIPRGTLKRLFREHVPGCRLGANVDLLFYLDFKLFLTKLAKEAEMAALKERGSVIHARHIEAVLPTVLKKFKS